jgi:membrane protein DedA with SNARE-associated domain
MAAFHGWIVQHAQFAGPAVFFIALAESLAVVGMIVPGVAMMFGAGALVGSGALPFGPICAYAVAGAIAGDGLSFWVGRHYRDRLASLWPFTRYPGMIEHGVAFFRRYGGLSVLFGRFVGPVRAVIPLVAGMLAMPFERFLLVNVISALLWGPAYLLPGMVFGRFGRPGVAGRGPARGAPRRFVGGAVVCAVAQPPAVHLVPAESASVDSSDLRLLQCPPALRPADRAADRS